MSAVITADNIVNEQLSSFEVNDPKVKFNFINTQPSRSVFITDMNTNYYDNNDKGLFICIVQSADKSINKQKFYPLQVDKQIYWL